MWNDDGCFTRAYRPSLYSVWLNRVTLNLRTSRVEWYVSKLCLVYSRKDQSFERFVGQCVVPFVWCLNNPSVVVQPARNDHPVNCQTALCCEQWTLDSTDLDCNLPHISLTEAERAFVVVQRVGRPSETQVIPINIDITIWLYHSGHIVLGSRNIELHANTNCYNPFLYQWLQHIWIDSEHRGKEKIIMILSQGSVQNGSWSYVA